MRKIYIILGFILLLSNYLNAQICDKINCDNIKNFIIIKIIEESIKTDPNESKLKEQFKKNTIESPIKYADFTSVLDTNNFSQTKQKLGDVINSINIPKDYIKDEFASKVLDLFASKLNDKQKKNCNFEQLRLNLIADIDNYLDEKIPDADTEKVNEISENEISQNKNNVNDYQVSDNSDSQSEKTSFFSFSNFNLFTLLGILLPLILFFIFFKITNEIYNKIERRRKEIEEIKQAAPSNQNVYDRTQMSMSEFEKLLSNSEVFEDFRKALENIQKQSSNNPQNTIVSSHQTIQQATTVTPLPSDIFYMKYPVENSFSNNHKSLSKENTIYKFFLKANKSEADFEIHTDGVKIDEILSMAEQTIKRGCDEDNNPSNSTKNIKTITKGIVSLEGDKWVIKRKALIRYE
jgi:hypothetical protein